MRKRYPQPINDFCFVAGTGFATATVWAGCAEAWTWTASFLLATYLCFWGAAKL